MNKAALPLLCATLLLPPALFPPALLSQPLTVCIFQTAGQQAAPNASDTSDTSDAATLATFLSVAAGPNALTAIPATGIAPKDMDAEAAKRGCAWIVTLDRGRTTQPSLPLDRGSSGGASIDPLFGPPRSGDSTHIEYSLRKPGSKKNSGHGSSNKTEWAALFPAEILEKIAAAR